MKNIYNKPSHKTPKSDQIWTNQGHKNVRNQRRINNLASISFPLSLKNHDFVKIGFGSKLKP
jgi:hypothetical protein